MTKRMKHNNLEGTKNRQASLVAKRLEFWCWYCDAALISPGSRCPNCGKKDKQKKKRIL